MIDESFLFHQLVDIEVIEAAIANEMPIHADGETESLHPSK